MISGWMIWCEHIRLYESFIWGKDEILIKFDPDHPTCFVRFLGSSNPRSVTHLFSHFASLNAMRELVHVQGGQCLARGRYEWIWMITWRKAVCNKLPAILIIVIIASQIHIFLIWLLDIESMMMGLIEKTTLFSDSIEALWSVGVWRPQFISMKYGVSRSPLNFTQDFLWILRCTMHCIIWLLESYILVLTLAEYRDRDMIWYAFHLLKEEEWLVVLKLLSVHVGLLCWWRTQGV